MSDVNEMFKITEKENKRGANSFKIMPSEAIQQTN